jgi:hypothetical protein
MAIPEDNVDKGLFEQDPHVDQLRPEPSAPPSDVVILEGLAGKSDREGWARLYFNRTLTYYAEFRREDIVFTEAIPPEQAPMVGLKATRVGIKKDAVIEYTRTTRAKAADEFDLDVQLGATPQLNANLSLSIGVCTQPFGCQTDQTCGCGTGATCHRVTCADTCERGCETRDTCNQVTCNTCATNCEQTCGICPTEGRTCRTCQTQCNQATCQTCQTHCVCTHVTCGRCTNFCGAL